MIFILMYSQSPQGGENELVMNCSFKIKSKSFISLLRIRFDIEQCFMGKRIFPHSNISQASSPCKSYCKSL